MTTNTAALICVGLKLIAVVAGLILVWAFPESRLCSSSLDFCEYFHPAMFYIYSLPFILTFIIVLGVVGFTMYRAHTFVVAPLTMDNDHDSMSQNMEMVAENENEPSLISLENYILNEAAQQPAPPMLQNFLSPLVSILDILTKYLRVTVLSLCLLGVNLPEHIMIIITWLTGRRMINFIYIRESKQPNGCFSLRWTQYITASERVV